MSLIEGTLRLPYKMKWRKWLFVGFLWITLLGAAEPENPKEAARAAKPAKPAKPEKIEKLAADVQNPVSDLLRFGLLNTNTFGAGRNNYDFSVFDLQTIWAKKFGNWGVVNRLNVPLIYLPSNAPAAPSGDSGSTFGLGDIQYTAFIARDEPKRLFKPIGGIGPTFLFDSATDDRLGIGKWGIGPSLAIVIKPDRWVNGVLVTNLWSFAGDDQRPDLNLFLLRPFVNYNVWKGWYLTSTPLITANWEATERDKWSVPIGGGVGKVALRVQKQPLNFRLQAFYFVEKADLAPDWTLSFEFQILFPQYDIEPRPEPDSTE